MGKSSLPSELDVFENSVVFACADNGHIIWAALTKNRNGICVWKDQTILFEPDEGDWGNPDLRWRPSDGALLVSSCEQGGSSAVWVWAVPGVSKTSG